MISRYFSLLIALVVTSISWGDDAPRLAKQPVFVARFNGWNQKGFEAYIRELNNDLQVGKHLTEAIDKNPKGPITSEQLNEGLRSMKGFTAEGMLPPVTISKADHQGGGRGRVAQWDGKRWAPKSDWMAADQDVIWQMIRTSSSDFKKSGK